MKVDCKLITQGPPWKSGDVSNTKRQRRSPSISFNNFEDGPASPEKRNIKGTEERRKKSIKKEEEREEEEEEEEEEEKKIT